MDTETQLFFIYILREWKKEVKKKPLNWADMMDEEDG
jgi:hypothetical protein